MLGNNEKIQGVNLSEVYSQMVRDLPWSVLLAYINANANLQKMCTIGGYRLDPNKRDRFEKIINREAEKSQFSEAVCNGVFAAWYPVHAELHDNLEDFFHSDEYKSYREEKGLGEDEYVLPDEKMDAFFKIEDLDLWRILLCFSPLKFTHEQAGKILDNQAGSAELVEKLKELEAKVEELNRKNEQLTAEAVRLRGKQTEDATELQELKKQNRQLRQDMELLQRRLESAQAESRRSIQQALQANEKQQDFETQLREEAGRAKARIQGDLDRVTKELQGWQARYEEQRYANRQLEENAQAAEKQRDQMIEERNKMERKLSESQNAADLLLSRIDWPKVGSAMKANPTLRKNLNSLIKKLNYEEDKALTIDGTLQEFWTRLSSGDASLIKKISKSSLEELATGDIHGYWKVVLDEFAEVQLNLEARLALINMMQNIFFQTLDMEDLETSKLPPKSKAKKKS